MVCDENASKWNAPKWNRAKVGHVKLGHVKLARAKLNAPNWHVIEFYNLGTKFAHKTRDCNIHTEYTIHNSIIIQNNASIEYTLILRPFVILSKYNY